MLSINDSTTNCPSGWHYFELTKSCYQLVNLNKIWSEAEQFCELKNAHLASITNSETNSFLTTLITEEYWIGGYKNMSFDSWEWSDGSSWGYTNWYSNQPNGRNETKLMLNKFTNGTWHDHLENATYPFICKYEVQ